jgi:antitoxin MazE
MESRVQKWGNSLAVRIPKPFASEVGLREDSAVDLRVSDGSLIITPTERPTYRLADLLADVRPSNLHSEVPTSEPQGDEAW